jgi:phosphosulfolactate synthase (CoM biosynthesis protein A)
VDEAPFSFIRTNVRPAKPRKTGVTEIRGPYYTPMGPHYLGDLLQTMGHAIDALKFAAGSFTVLTPASVRSMIELCHQNQVTVSTGGFIEYVLTQGDAAVEQYVARCAELCFDTIEISSGFITLSPQSVIKLVDRVHREGLKAKVEVGIQIGAGGASSAEALRQQGTHDVQWVIDRAKAFIDHGADALMLESEGITECVERADWRLDVPPRVADAVGIERIMFEAADPEVFSWYVQTFGPDVNLFVDHSQIVQLECLRRGIWGTSATWGRVIGI